MHEANKEFIQHLFLKYVDNCDSLEDFLSCTNMIKTDIELELTNRLRNCECFECGRVLSANIMRKQNSRYCCRCDEGGLKNGKTTKNMGKN